MFTNIYKCLQMNDHSFNHPLKSSTEPPSLYYNRFAPDEEILAVSHVLDIPIVLGQEAFLQMLWYLTRAHCLLDGVEYIATYMEAMQSIYRVRSKRIHD